MSPTGEIPKEVSKRSDCKSCPKVSKGTVWYCADSEQTKPKADFDREIWSSLLQNILASGAPRQEASSMAKLFQLPEFGFKQRSWKTFNFMVTILNLQVTWHVAEGCTKQWNALLTFQVEE